MAKSQYEYVKQFELSDTCLPKSWLLCRIDGVAFTKFTASHNLQKPNDDRARDLMNVAAKTVMTEYTEICMAYGVSDEYSFVIHPDAQMYSRRSSKITSAIVSLFTSAYVANWSTYFPTSSLTLNNLPYFDGRLVCYPTDEVMRDYLRWRQVDCHINNLYNTTFWKLVREYQSTVFEGDEKQARERAHEEMNCLYANSAQKNDLLHERFGVNYNDEADAYRKGSIIIWKEAIEAAVSQTSTTGSLSSSFSSDTTHVPSSISSSSADAAVPFTAGAPRPKRVLTLLHCDIMNDSFYTEVCPGIIPYRSWSEQMKDKKAADKAAKKAAHKEREKQEKAAAKSNQACTSQSNASPEGGIEGHEPATRVNH